MNIEDESMRGYEFDDKLRNYYNVYESIYRIFPFMISTNWEVMKRAKKQSIVKSKNHLWEHLIIRRKKVIILRISNQCCLFEVTKKYSKIIIIKLGHIFDSQVLLIFIPQSIKILKKKTKIYINMTLLTRRDETEQAKIFILYN